MDTKATLLKAKLLSKHEPKLLKAHTGPIGGPIPTATTAFDGGDLPTAMRADVGNIPTAMTVKTGGIPQAMTAPMGEIPQATTVPMGELPVAKAHTAGDLLRKAKATSVPVKTKPKLEGEVTLGPTEAQYSPVKDYLKKGKK